MNTLAHIFSQPFPTEVNAQAWRAWLAFAFDSAKAAKNLPENPSCRLYEGCEHELGKEEGDEDLRRRIIHDDKAVKIDLQRRIDLTKNTSSRSKSAGISLLEQALSSHEPQDATFLKDIRSSESTVECFKERAGRRSISHANPRPPGTAEAAQRTSAFVRTDPASNAKQLTAIQVPMRPAAADCQRET